MEVNYNNIILGKFNGNISSSEPCYSLELASFGLIKGTATRKIAIKTFYKNDDFVIALHSDFVSYLVNA